MHATRRKKIIGILHGGLVNIHSDGKKLLLVSSIYKTPHWVQVRGYMRLLKEQETWVYLGWVKLETRTSEGQAGWAMGTLVR